MKHDYKRALKITNARGNLSKIAREMRTLTHEELHDEDVAFEIAFERACDIVGKPHNLHRFYTQLYQDYYTKTVRFEDNMRSKFCYKGGYSIGLSDEVVRAAVRIMTKFAESTEQEWVNKDWLIRQAEDAARSCNMNSYLSELIGYFRAWQKALTKNIQTMRRLENGETETE